MEWDFATWCVAIALSTYAVTASPGAILPASTRATWSLWLTEREEGRWADKFADLFDYVFGHRTLTWRRLLTSASASMVALGLLYWLFGPILGLMGGRTQAAMPLTQVLLLGLFLNVTADFVSLAETRWLLERFRHTRSIPLQLLLLLLDLFLSAAIILTAIYAYRWATGQPPLTPAELVAGYTAYAIFFYSTFLTSIWAWGFCLSAWVIRLTARTPIRHLDIYERPFNVLGMIAGAMTFAVLFFAFPFARQQLPEDIDGALCDSFGGRMCTHAARLTDDEAKALERIKRACTTGDLAQCQRAIQTFPDLLVTDAMPYLFGACASRSPLACNALGWIYFEGTIVAQDYQAARAAYDASCNAGDAKGCSGLAYFYANGLGGALDYNGARDLYGYACAADVPDLAGCTGLGWMYLGGHGVGQDQDRARELFDRACEAGDEVGCYWLGHIYHHAIGVNLDFDKAAQFYKWACDDGEQGACEALEALPDE
ncbi:MAG: tetratricopeptide repeat protein [Pseudomonadota bacterium]